MIGKHFTKEELALIKKRVEAAFQTENMSEVARRIKVNVTTLHNYFSGRSILPMRILEQLSKESEVSVDYLLNGVEDNVDDFITHAIVWIKETDAAESERTREMIRLYLNALPRKTAKP